MLPVLLVLLAADAEPTPQPAPSDALPDTRAKETAQLGVATALAAGGLAFIIPFADGKVPGSTPIPLIFGITAFAMVAFVRPAVFFAGQKTRAPPTALNHGLRVLGTATALLGLVSLIAGFALRPSNAEHSNWAMAGAASIEALSAAAFSIDALLGINE